MVALHGNVGIRLHPVNPVHPARAGCLWLMDRSAFRPCPGSWQGAENIAGRVQTGVRVFQDEPVEAVRNPINAAHGEQGAVMHLFYPARYALPGEAPGHGVRLARVFSRQCPPLRLLK